MSAYEATVEVLTAEVRVLMVGSRQVTLSVAKQLDQVDPDDIEPFGRIRTGARLPFAATGMIEVIGKADDGSLVRSTEVRESYRCDRASENQRVTFNGRDCITLRCPEHPTGGDHFWDSDPDVLDEWETLPLIVLAGLR